MSPAPVSPVSIDHTPPTETTQLCRALIAAISASDLHSVSYPRHILHIHISCFPHLQAHQAFKLPLPRCPLHRWYSALVNRKAEVAGSISCAGCWWQLAYCLLRLGPGPVSWEAELQLHTGQKKSVFTTPHFVLRDTLEWIVKYFVRFAIFRIHTLTQHTQSLLLSFNCGKRLHNTMSICQILEWTKHERCKGKDGNGDTCHALCCRCGDR